MNYSITGLKMKLSQKIWKGWEDALTTEKFKNIEGLDNKESNNDSLFLPMGGKENASVFPEKSVSNDDGNQEQPIVSPHKVYIKDYILPSLVGVFFLLLLLFFVHLSDEKVIINNQTAACIGGNASVIILPTCSACAKQKQILGAYIQYIPIIDLSKQQEITKYYNITKVPTWIIKNKAYSGTKSWEELRNLTGC